MKLSVYARRVGVSYRTAFRWFKSGKIQGRQMDTGTILITEPVDEQGRSGTGFRQHCDLFLCSTLWPAPFQTQN